MFKTWKERWIVLDQGTLRYYSTQAPNPPYGEDLRGEYFLADATLVFDKTTHGCGKIMVQSPKEGILLLNAGQNYKLKADWMKAIDAHIDFANRRYIKLNDDVCVLEQTDERKQLLEGSGKNKSQDEDEVESNLVVLKNSHVPGVRVASLRLIANSVQYLPTANDLTATSDSEDPFASPPTRGPHAGKESVHPAADKEESKPQGGTTSPLSASARGGGPGLAWTPLTEDILTLFDWVPPPKQKIIQPAQSLSLKTSSSSKQTIGSHRLAVNIAEAVPAIQAGTESPLGDARNLRSPLNRLSSQQISTPTPVLSHHFASTPDSLISTLDIWTPLPVAPQTLDPPQQQEWDESAPPKVEVLEMGSHHGSDSNISSSRRGLVKTLDAWIPDTPVSTEEEEEHQLTSRNDVPVSRPMNDQLDPLPRIPCPVIQMVPALVRAPHPFKRT